MTNQPKENSDQKADETIAERVLNFMRGEYIRDGYLYSACAAPDYIACKLRADYQETVAAIEELIAKGKLQKRNCAALNYELTPRERHTLIEEHNLAKVWEQGEGRWFRPNDKEYGEISNVRRRILGEELLKDAA